MIFRILTGLVLSLLLLISHASYAMIGMAAPDITNRVWINSDSQSLRELRGQVVLVEFWTFGCYNCRNVEPQIKQWHQTYAQKGLIVIGVHSPEFSYEKNVEAVKRYVKEHHIRYPVTIDNDFSTWNRFGNRYWPAVYLLDKQGIIRYVRVGEGGYSQTEQVIQALLAENI